MGPRTVVSVEQIGFEFDVQPRRLSKVSPARLATFDDCPRRYRLAYLERPTPQRTGPWAHSTLGAVVHNALRALFDLPVRKRTPQRAAALVTTHWKDAGFADAAQAAIYRERAQGWVSDYVESNDVEMDPVGLERWVSAPVNPETGEHANPTMIIEGRADRIDQRGRELVIVDYKTGKRAPDEHEARVAGARDTPSPPRAPCACRATAWNCTTCPAARSRRPSTPPTACAVSSCAPRRPPRTCGSRPIPWRLRASRTPQTRRFPTPVETVLVVRLPPELPGGPTGRAGREIVGFACAVRNRTRDEGDRWDPTPTSSSR